MRRSTLLVLIALGAAIVGFAIASAAGRIGSDKSEPASSAAAPPQAAKLGWHEALGSGGERLEFGVGRFEVLDAGWRAHLSVRNASKVAFDLERAHRSFGLMLFGSGKHEELTQRNSAGTLPAVRAALEYDPPLPPVLEPNASWSGTISARGSLAAGSWVRFVFGTFEAIGAAPDDFGGSLSWITDHAYRLRR
jgi:hypothetical protein